MSRHISLVLADQIIELLQGSGSTEAERYVALEVARALVPVMPNASCSAEDKEVT